MYREFYSALSSTTLPLVTMLFFLVAFLLVLARLFLLRRRHDYDHLAALPLEDAAPATDADRQTPGAREVKP